MTTLESTHRLRPRPVWARRELRMTGALAHFPTDEEMADAIDVLRVGPTLPRSLYVEAETILVEHDERRIVSEGEFRSRLQMFDG